MELEKGDLESQPLFTFIRARQTDAHWRYMVHVEASEGFGTCWLGDDGVRWRSRDVKAEFIELLWHPKGLHTIPPGELAEVRVLKTVANSGDRPVQRTAPPRLTPPGDFEPENALTDGSLQMEIAELRRQLADSDERNRRQHMVLVGARVIVENMMGNQEVRRDGTLQKELRELSMVLNNGDAIRRTARAEEAVEEWLQDPRRSIFGLAADLATILSPTAGAWKK